MHHADHHSIQSLPHQAYTIQWYFIRQSEYIHTGFLTKATSSRRSSWIIFCTYLAACRIPLCAFASGMPSMETSSASNATSVNASCAWQLYRQDNTVCGAPGDRQRELNYKIENHSLCVSSTKLGTRTDSTSWNYRFRHGESMDYPWMILGESLDNPWRIPGWSLENPWIIPRRIPGWSPCNVEISLYGKNIGAN